MKYMGSKRALLLDGLGEVLRSEGSRAGRVIDLFSGSGAVSWFVAQVLDVPVLAVDLQRYAQILAGAVIERTHAIDVEPLVSTWLEMVRADVQENGIWREWSGTTWSVWNLADTVREAREFCAASPECGTVWGSYGGYYFSPAQALTFDYMLRGLPSEEPYRSVCHAAIISAASSCAAGPGHTAQPFRPTYSAGIGLCRSWQRDPLALAERALRRIAPQYARVFGRATVGDAAAVGMSSGEGDLVFVDPPYSAVQYSRFYHVLETIARGGCGTVEGAGRYPPLGERPQSAFSRRGDAAAAMESLLGILGSRRATVVLTFPTRLCSNGLSAEKIVELAGRWYEVECREVGSRFSTLGGNNLRRLSRLPTREVVAVLRRQ
jgi:adenine-specific DNA-methyltransferase